MGENLFAAFRDRQSVKEGAVVDLLALFGALVLKEAADHKLIERLAKTPRASKQCHHRLILDYLLYHQSFIDKISVFFNNRFKILHTDGDFLFYRIAHFFTLPSESLRFLSVPYIHL